MTKRILGISLIFSGSFLGGFACLFLVAHLERRAIAQAPAATDLAAVGDRFEKVAKLVSPAVVYVEARKPAEKPTPGTTKVVEESGSGVIIRLPGRPGHFVLTNHHVIAGARSGSIIIQLADGRVLNPARIWGHAESDVAVMSVEGAGDLPTAAIGDSDKVRVGNWVLAIGSPFGLNQTVTHGILSARERGQINLGEAIHIKDFLQTDAAINPGSSGGPLLNMNGEVIGINTAIASPNGSNSGVAFSIPINLFKRIAEQLLEKGSVSRGYIGIQLSHTFEPADAVKLGMTRAGGALVEYIFPGTPAERAGIQVGDVIMEANQKQVQNENQLINYISGLPAGTPVNFVIWRERRQISVQATVGERPPSAERR